MRSGLSEIRLRYRKDISVNGIEALCDISCNLQMLHLVPSNRNDIRLIQQNIRRHQNRICKKTGINVIRMFRSFILILRHTVQFPHIGKAIQNPGKFGVSGNVGLVINTIFLRVESRRNI